MIRITCPDDVVRLPWAGNFRDDAKLFGAVDSYIQREPNLRKRQEADWLASVHGMGADCEIDPDYDPRQ